jgi:hypothetical protein
MEVKDLIILLITVLINIMITVIIVKKMTIKIIEEIYLHIEKADREIFQFIEDKLL